MSVQLRHLHDRSETTFKSAILSVDYSNHHREVPSARWLDHMVGSFGFCLLLYVAVWHA